MHRCSASAGAGTPRALSRFRGGAGAARCLLRCSGWRPRTCSRLSFRTSSHACMTRRWLDPETASDLGTLDATAIERVREEAWPLVRSADELHDALVILGFLTAEEGRRAGGSPGPATGPRQGDRPAHDPPSA